MTMASTAFTTAKIIGLTGAAWLSGKLDVPLTFLCQSETPKPRAAPLTLAGTIASISLVSVPAIMKSLAEDGLTTSQAIRLWRNNFELGKALAPPIALATASSLAFCGWSARSLGALGWRDGRLFFVSAVLTVAIVPFTIVSMGSTNAKLLSLAKKEGLTASEGREGEVLLEKWCSLNRVRSLLPLAGAVLTGFAVLA